MRLPRSLAPLALLAAPLPLQAQQITRVIPEAAAPGDLVIVQGNGFAGATGLAFTGIVGGFAGQFTLEAPAVSVSATEVRAIVPLFNSFTPPSAVPPGSPFGSVAVSLGGSSTADSTLFLMEGHHPFGSMSSAGAATTLSNGERAYTSFDLDGDVPVAGAAGVSFRIENALPFSVSYLLGGVPSVAPPLPIGDGLLALDPAAVFVFGVQPLDASGDATYPAFPVSPNLAGKTAVVQGLVVDFGLPGTLGVASALQVTL